MIKLFFVTLCFCVHSLSYGSGLRVQIHSVEAKSFPEVGVNFSVYDGSGQALDRLQRDNIYFFENGKKIENYYMEVATDPVELTLVIDDSGSMHYMLEPLISAVKKFLDMLSERDSASIVSFSDSVRVLHPQSTDKRSLKKSLDRLQGFGATALYDGIFKGADLLSGKKKSAIVVLSDGVDQNRENTGPISRKSAIESLTNAVRKELPIYTIGLGRRINRQELKDFARLSKGSFYYAPTISQLEDLYTLIARNLKNDVKIKFSTPNPTKDANFRNLELEVRSENLRGYGSANYFSPGKFVLETTGFGYHWKKGNNGRDQEIDFQLTDENGIRKNGSKEFFRTWINQLGK